MYYIGSFGVVIVDFETPGINGLSLLLFIGYFVINLNSLIDIQLDYKEAKGKL